MRKKIQTGKETENNGYALSLFVDSSAFFFLGTMGIQCVLTVKFRHVQGTI